MGNGTPFRQDELIVGEVMEKGELYLAANGCARPLHLQHLVTLRQSPDTARFSCYFYNRLEDNGVRLVSYHFADRTDVTEPFEDVAEAVRQLVGTSEADPR
jgi:hypothetical protein